MKVAPCQGQGLSGSYAQLVIPGQPLGTFYGKKFIGIVDGKEQFANNGESEIIGCAQPDFTYGISTTLRYKNWSLSMNLRGSVGNDVYNCTANNLSYLNNLPGRNVLKEAVTAGVNREEAKVFSSRFIEDGSFLRMDNLSLGYDFSFKPLRITRAPCICFRSEFIHHYRIFRSGPGSKFGGFQNRSSSDGHRLFELSESKYFHNGHQRFVLNLNLLSEDENKKNI